MGEGVRYQMGGFKWVGGLPPNPKRRKRGLLSQRCTEYDPFTNHPSILEAEFVGPSMPEKPNKAPDEQELKIPRASFG